MEISELMKRDPVMINPDMSLKEAAEKMKEVHTGVLPVGQEGKPIGMLTDRDITIRATAEGKSPSETKVRDIMTDEVIACGENCSPREAFEKMRQNEIGRLLVTESSGKVIGIVSMADLIGSASNDIWECVEHAAQYGKRKSA